MSEMEALEKRRKVVTDQIVRLRQELVALEGELIELTVAGKVLARVTGAKFKESGDSGCDFLMRGIPIQAKVVGTGHSCIQNLQMLDSNMHRSMVFPTPPSGFAGGSPGWDILAKKELSLPEKITVAMRYAFSQSVEELAPKDIERYLIILFGDVPETQNVSSVAWRMAKSGSLCKAEKAPRYWLPRTNKAADSEPREGASTALVSTRAKGREAAPGGGT
ncbi:hypothetical protein [Agrobacterium tumefaciens]|uniref:hypothetical protein n=1 Tax=Agrobacterium tumefaciens TaxID=358 RepID=UPI0022449FA7|nr:hypothetical protein [Agrobacterium tumefaciens]MCW8060130.1 hypothetical protein [Agrobacterium tumefaciens]